MASTVVLVSIFATSTSVRGSRHQFRVERRDRALYVPPSSHRLILRTARMWERAGRQLAPQFAGLTITEAVKDVYAAIPLAAKTRRRVVLSEAA